MPARRSFANESEQRQVMVNMVDRILLEDAAPEEALSESAAAEQAILDAYYE